MTKTVQYFTGTDRQQALDDNSHLILVEEQNITEGNFLIFVEKLKLPSTIELANDKLDLLIQMQLEKEGIL